MTSNNVRPKGMKAFTIIWFGELISIIGTGLTSFALGVWVYNNTGSATLFALITLCATLPAILVAPFAGTLVDRWDQRKVMVYSDTGAALCTAAIALLIWGNMLQIWHIYIIMGFASVCNAFQQPAYQVSATMLVPKENYLQASGMMQAGMGAQFIVSPVLAGLLLGPIGINGIILIDFLTFFMAIGCLMYVRIPRPSRTQQGTKGRGSLLSETMQSWIYLKEHSGLLSVLIMIACGNFMIGFLAVLAGPMMLSLFESEKVYGTTMSIAGSGMLIGSVVLGASGGPKKLITGLIVSMLIGGTGIFVMGLRPNVYLITLACFTFFLSMPFGRGCFETLLRTKIVPDMQGRIFAFTRMVAMASTTTAYLVAGPLTDYLFEPLMAADGLLANSLGRIIGVGPGRGIGFLLMIAGATIILITIISYRNPHVRHVEQELPDVVINEDDVEAQLVALLP